MVINKNNIAEGKALSSAGHKLGQIIGDWWETKIIFPLLSEVAQSLNLYLDNKIMKRGCRSEKVQWADIDGNFVDYDYVLEIGGTKDTKGIPVAFLESFWRRGARHSKDKARDDTNKLLPMREAYPTARFLAIAACGEFTEPARDYVRSKNVELFFISKEKIISAFESAGITIDYPDSLPEEKKNDLVKNLERQFTEDKQLVVSSSLRNAANESSFLAFKQRIIGSLAAMPQEIRIFLLKKYSPMIFENIHDAENFLQSKQPHFETSKGSEQYEYEVVFSDGSEFGRSLNSLFDVKEINRQLSILVTHMQSMG